jgi:hypothetical protein
MLDASPLQQTGKIVDDHNIRHDFLVISASSRNWAVADRSSLLPNTDAKLVDDTLENDRMPAVTDVEFNRSLCDIQAANALGQP